MKNKKIIAIVALIVLVAMLGICLVACNADDYKGRLEKAGYKVTVAQNDDKDENIDWMVTGINLKEGEAVIIIKFAKIDDAKAAESDSSEYTGLISSIPGVKIVTDRSSKIVFIGTEKGIKDAK